MPYGVGAERGGESAGMNKVSASFGSEMSGVQSKLTFFSAGAVLPTSGQGVASSATVFFIVTGETAGAWAASVACEGGEGVEH